MPLKLNSTGGGSVTLDAPVTASNLTQTLPAVSGTAAVLASVTNNGVVYVNSSGQPTSGSGLVFDGTNLGVGTSSPSFVLDVGGALANIRVAPSTTTNNALTRYVNAGGTGYVGLDNSAGGLGAAYGLHMFHTGAYPIVFSTNSTERMRLDSSGNLGLGVTPSAWLANRKVFSVGGATVATVNHASSIGETTYNSYWATGGSATYQNNGYAAIYEFNNSATGGFAWKLAPSGTAGNAISFTQAMTLDASGNLGLGTSTPSTGTLNTQLTINSGAGTYAGVVIQNSTTGSSYNDGMALYIAGATGGTIMLYEAAPLTFGTSSLERMRIDANGKVLINTTANPLAATINIAQPNNASWALSYQLGNTALGTVYTNTSGTAQYTALGFYNNGGTYSSCGQVVVSGTSTAYNTSSDYRLKENIQPMQNALARNAKLKPVTYRWKTDGATGEGFIAHELQEIVPDAVTGEKDAVDKDGNPVYQGVDTSFLVGHLVACINELKAELDELKAKVQ